MRKSRIPAIDSIRSRSRTQLYAYPENCLHAARIEIFTQIFTRVYLKLYLIIHTRARRRETESEMKVEAGLEAGNLILLPTFNIGVGLER